MCKGWCDGEACNVEDCWKSGAYVAPNERVEIKNCPFCGSQAVFREETGWGTMWVMCTNCGAEGGYVDKHDGRTRLDAIEKWNERV